MVDGSRSGFIPHTKLYITTTRFLKGFVKIFYLIFLEFNPDGMRNRVLVRTEGLSVAIVIGTAAIVTDIHQRFLSRLQFGLAFIHHF